MNQIVIIAGILLLLSFIIALRSMRDFHVPKELKWLSASRKVKGTIVLMKGKHRHYHAKRG